MEKSKVEQKYKGVRRIEKRQIEPKKNQQDLMEQKQHVPKLDYENSWKKFFKN